MSDRKASELLGKDVTTESGHDLGQLKDWVIDIASWKVKGLSVRLSRDALDLIHVKKPLFGSQDVVIATGDVVGIADRIVIKKTIDELAQLAGAETQGDDGDHA
ncbi:MAG: PRC-barrel domain-containing protein [Myxococcales bacterium]|nr:PRC-barrel domain-containing protein [Myxococcales bacterium]